MKFESMYLTGKEIVLAVSCIANKDFDNEICSLVKIDSGSDGYDVMDLVNSIDDGYFPDKYSPSKEERKYHAHEIEPFLDGKYDNYYALFIRERFCGFIKYNMK